MNQIFKIFNVKSEKELNNLLEELNLNYSDMFLIEDIASQNIPINEQRQQILDIIGINDKNIYEKCIKQFKKSGTRQLKENVMNNLTLNDIMELNDLIDLVASKCSDKMLYQQIYQYIVKATSKNIANAFFNMVCNSKNNDSNLKFNTDLIIDGQNLAQLFFSMKENLISFINSLKENKTEKVQEQKETTKLVENEIDSTYNLLSDLINKNSDSSILQQAIKQIEEKIVSAKSIEEKNTLSKLKTMAETKLNQLNECLASNVVASAVEEDTFNGLLDEITKPTIINITVNKENGQMDEIPCQEVNCEKKLDIVQPVEICPTTVDQPILARPNKAELVSALTALNSHVNDIKSDSRDNNIECLQTINTLLNQISNYFNSTLSESVEINKDGVMVVDESVLCERNQKPCFTYTYQAPNGEYLEFTAYQIQPNMYDIDLMDGDYNYITTSDFNIDGAQDDNIIIALNKIDTNINWNEIESHLIHKISTCIDDYQLDEETVYDHSWYENDDGDFPKRTKDGIIIENELSTYNRIAGVYDINNQDFEELEKGEEHNLSLKDYQNGKIRYGIQPTEKYGMICYITAIDKGYAYKAMKKIKQHYKDINIDTFNLEFRTDDGQKMFVKLDSNLHQIFENENVENFTSEDIHNKLEKEKQSLKDESIEETCSAGATCAGSVAMVQQPIKKKKKNKAESISENLFFNLLKNNINTAHKFNDDLFEYNNGYLFKNNKLVKTTNINEMIAYINGEINLPLIENILPNQMKYLMEEDSNLSYSDISPEQRQLKQNTEQELDNSLQGQNTIDVSVENNDNNTSQIQNNQEVVGVDDSDIQNKQYILKDKTSGKYQVADASKIKIEDNTNTNM